MQNFIKDDIIFDSHCKIKWSNSLFSMAVDWNQIAISDLNSPYCVAVDWAGIEEF